MALMRLFTQLRDQPETQHLDFPMEASRGRTTPIESSPYRCTYVVEAIESYRKMARDISDEQRAIIAHLEAARAEDLKGVTHPSGPPWMYQGTSPDHSRGA